jgi:Saxitoxin biosynthesis operon protein SxtJ
MLNRQATPELEEAHDLDYRPAQLWVVRDGDMGTHERLGGAAERRITASNRKFGLTIGCVLALIGAIKLVPPHSLEAWPWLLAAAPFILLAVFAPPLLRPLAKIWMRLGLLLHRITTPIILRLLYWGAIAPTGLAVRLSGRDPLRLQRDPTASTYWIPRDPSRATPLDKQY